MNSVMQKLLFVIGILITAICGCLTIVVFFNGFLDGDPGGFAVFVMFALATVVGIALIRYSQTLSTKLVKAGAWAENKVIGVMDENDKKKNEAEMLRIKNLYDEGILSQDEYDQKIQSLKDKYFEK